MTTALHELPLFDLAEVMRARFAPGLARLAGAARLDRRELPGLAVVVTADALARFDPERGDFPARWWFACNRHFAGMGRPAPGIDAPSIDPAGGDNPADILEACQEFERLAAVGIVAGALRHDSAPDRSRRRHAASTRGAARAYGRGPQGELFGGERP